MPTLIDRVSAWYRSIFVAISLAWGSTIGCWVGAQEWSDTILPVSLNVGYAVRLVDLNRDNRLDIAIVDSKRIVWLEVPFVPGTERSYLASRDAQSSGVKRAIRCHDCLTSDRTARAVPLLMTESDDNLIRLECCDDRSSELVRLADVPGKDLSSRSQLLGLKLASEFRILALRVKRAEGGRLESGGIQMANEDHPKDVLFSPRLSVSA